MVKIVIVDDERAELAKNQALVAAYFRSRGGIPYRMDAFSDPQAFLQKFAAGERADVYLLDIVMPALSGIALGAEIRQQHADAKILYLTTSAEYGVASYDVQAVDYLLKPCDPARLKKAMDRVMDARRPAAAPRFFVKVPDGVYALSQRDILYTEYYDHRLIVHTTDGRTIESITQREPLAVLVQPLLREPNFLRISASFVVNMDHIVRLSKHEFEIAGGRKLQISRTYSDSRSVYLDYVLNHN